MNGKNKCSFPWPRSKDLFWGLWILIIYIELGKCHGFFTCFYVSYAITLGENLPLHNNEGSCNQSLLSIFLDLLIFPNWSIWLSATYSFHTYLSWSLHVPFNSLFLNKDNCTQYNQPQRNTFGTTCLVFFQFVKSCLPFDTSLSQHYKSNANKINSHKIRYHQFSEQ